MEVIIGKRSPRTVWWQRADATSVAFWLALTAAGPLYAVLIADALEALRGSISKGKAFELTCITILLWVALMILLVTSGARKLMPSWAVRPSVLLTFLSGVSTFLAMNMYREPKHWPVIFPVGVPVLISLYAVWARLPRLRAVLPAEQSSTVFLVTLAIAATAPILLLLAR